MSKMIETEDLSRSFGDIKAVDRLNFSVEKGEVLGFLGPNGAGKSTTMKMLTCFLTPSEGTARVAGFDVVKESRNVRANLGYLPENAPLYGEMDVGAFLRFIAEVRGIRGGEATGAVSKVLGLTSLDEVVHQKIETLSKGFKRRVGLAQALIHDPEILILDEPTDGLDPNQKHEVRTLIRTMAQDKCIILSTHILEEVDEVCSRAVIIAKGKIVADDSPQALRKRSPQFGSVSLRLQGASENDNIRSALQKLPNVKKVEIIAAGKEHECVVHPSNGQSILAAVVDEVQKNSWAFTDIRQDGGNLDEVFRQITN